MTWRARASKAPAPRLKLKVYVPSALCRIASSTRTRGNRTIEFRAECLDDRIVAAAHVKALVAVGEDAERLGSGIDEGEEIERRLLVALEAHFAGVGNFDQFAQPARGAIAIEPLAHRLPIQRFDAPGRRIGDLGVGQGFGVAADRRRERRELAQDVLLAVATTIGIPDIAKSVRRILGKVIEDEAQLGRERPDPRMPGIDQLAAEFADLAIGEMVAQAEHASADALLGFVEAHADTGLAQAPGGGQSGDAGTHDDHLIGIGRVLQRHARAGRQHQCRRGTGRLLQESTPR